MPSAGTVLVIGLGKVGLAALCLVRKLAPAAKIIAVDKDDARFSLACSLNKTDHVWKMYTCAPLSLFAFADDAQPPSLPKPLQQRCQCNRNTVPRVEIEWRRCSHGASLHPSGGSRGHCHSRSQERTRCFSGRVSSVGGIISLLSILQGGSVIFCRHNIDMRHVLPLAPSNEVSLITTGNVHWKRAEQREAHSSPHTKRAGGLVSDAHVQSVLEILRTESALRKLFLLRARPTK